MVLLCSANNINIKSCRIMKCLEEKKKTFKIFDLSKKELEENVITYDPEEVKSMTETISELKSSDIRALDTIFHSK